MAPKQTDPQFKLRMTPEIKDAIEAAAAANNRSMNAEIVHRLEMSIIGNGVPTSLDEIAKAFVMKLVAEPGAIPESQKDRFHESYEAAKKEEAKIVRRFMEVAASVLQGKRGHREQDDNIG